MSRYRKIINRIFTSIFLVVLLSININASAADGEALFKANCASCHKPDKDYTGPALKGWKERQPEGWIYKWVASPAALIASGDAYATKLYATWKGNGMMSNFQQLKKEDINAIMKYVDDYAPPPVATTVGEKTGEGDNNSLLFGILTLVLALIAFILLQVNSNLRKLADDHEGIPTSEPIPFYRNKSYITLLTLVLFVVAG